MVGRKLAKIAILGAVAIPLAAAAGFIGVHAQTAQTITMTPTKGLEAGLSGTAVITPMANNQLKVDITVNGLPANADRAAHIHKPGTDTTDPAGCDTGGAIVYPLTDVKSGASGPGTSTTTVTLDATKGIPTTGWYVNVHQKSPADGVGAGVICGKITASVTGGAAASTGTPQAAASGAGSAQQAAAGTSPTASKLPASGLGGPASSETRLIVALALVAFAIGGAGLVVSRKRS